MIRRSGAQIKCRRERCVLTTQFLRNCRSGLTARKSLRRAGRSRPCTQWPPLWGNDRGRLRRPPLHPLHALHPCCHGCHGWSADSASRERQQSASGDRGGAGTDQSAGPIWRPRQSILAPCRGPEARPVVSPEGRPHGRGSQGETAWAVSPSAEGQKNHLQRRPQRADLPAQYAALAAPSKDNRRRNTPKPPVAQGFVHIVSHLGDENISSDR